MQPADSVPDFAGSIPQLYERLLVPLIFESYADDLVRRVARRRPSRVLEIAAGTGVVTRRLAQALPPEVPIVATDLSQPMLDQAAALGACRPVEWRQADAMRLAFDDGAFDAVVCQFGIMFFADKARAFAEARRVLQPGGVLVFNVWQGLDRNEFADTVMQALATVFPDDPPRFIERIPHGYHDPETIVRDLEGGGFDRSSVAFDTIAGRSRADSPQIVATAFCQGTPVRLEIEGRDASRLAEATATVAAAIGRRFGSGEVEGRIQGLVVTAER